LPGRVRLPARGLYAFCRASDDLVDGTMEPGPAAAIRGAAHLRARLDAVYAGQPGHTVEDRVFEKLVTAFAIPRAIPEALIEGFEWDEEGRVYQTLNDLIAYAARVASTVGVMMTLIMGVRDRDALARAADLGIAMQLTNIARDVGEDARRGRLYLPHDWMVEAGLDPEAWLADPAHDHRLAAVVARLLATADIYYDRGLTGVSALPLDCRTAIRSAAFIYREIGRDVARAGYNSVDRRARTTKNKKIELILYAAAQPFQFMPVMTLPTHASAQFLVDESAERQGHLPRNLNEKASRFIELLAVAERRRVLAQRAIEQGL
jgi:15-cis-phytoene synthase